MATCGVCGSSTIMPETYGTLTLCKKCALKVLTPKWKNRSYSTNSEVEDQKRSTVKLAKLMGFPSTAVKALESYFESLKTKGLVLALDGGVGQNLAVMDTYFGIDTTEFFHEKKAEKQYASLLSGVTKRKANDNADSALVAKIAGDVLSGLALGGGIGRTVMRAGAGLASDIVSKSLI